MNPARILEPSRGGIGILISKNQICPQFQFVLTTAQPKHIDIQRIRSFCTEEERGWCVASGDCVLMAWKGLKGFAWISLILAPFSFVLVLNPSSSIRRRPGTLRVKRDFLEPVRSFLTTRAIGMFSVRKRKMSDHAYKGN